VKLPKAWSSRLDHGLKWTGLMSEWDAFSHRAAAARAQDRTVARMLQATEHLTPLLALGQLEKGKPDWDICADLWLNALRRGERGRYDDAVARLYRLTEAAAQTHLWKRYGLESGRIPLRELPESMPYHVSTDRKTGEPYVQLALSQTVELLRTRDAGDPLAAAYGSTSEGSAHGPPWLTKRNHSILAHGFVSVDEKSWEEARGWVETNVVRFLSDRVFRQLPRAIPPSQGAAV
jgi:CRISPR-associated protein (TIGR02710 family)